MVLVAAIAAGVLINTAGFLQSQAEATGQESTDLVSERIEVSSSVGVVADGGNVLSSIQIGVSAAPGADNIDLSETIIQVNGPEGQQTLTMANYGDGVANADTSFVDSGPYVAGASGTPNAGSETGIDSPGSLTFRVAESGDGSDLNNALADNEIDPRGIPQGEFIVVDSNNDLVNPSDAVLNGDNNDYILVVNPFVSSFGGGSADLDAFSQATAFGQGEQAQLDIISPSSSTTQVDLNAPDLFDGEGEAVRL
jgi:flagellin FlaB